jgi:DNA-binding response OmpR family regulator
MNSALESTRLSPISPAGHPALKEFADMRVLVVESGTAHGGLVSTILQRAWLTQIACASTGAEALRQSRDGADIDLVLIDMVLPDMDGLQLCCELPNVPAILMLTPESAWRNDIGRATGAAARADLLFRPIHELELVPRVRRALALRRKTL